VSKKKTVARTFPPAGELPTAAEALPAHTLVANGDVPPELHPEPASAEPELRPEAPGEAPASKEPARQEDATSGPDAAPVGSVLELALAPPLAQPVSLTLPPTEPTLASLTQRVEKLEAAMSQVQDVQAFEQRIAERVANRIQREKPAPAAEPASPVLAKAAALLGAGKQLIPSLVRQDAAPAASSPRQAHPASTRMWLVWELLAEARTILRMYVDPRWSLSWMGRIVPPVLLAAFVLVYYWVPFTSFYVVGPLLEKSVQLVIAFVLFKVLGHEARRYREKAPDLPPSLRL
jgi:hypothetical protein